MSETTVFEDLNLLSGHDLRAVFDQLPTDQVTAALWGCQVGLRTQLIRKLPRSCAKPIEQAIATTEHLSFTQVRHAQQQVVSAMCQLSRAGIIAFDLPEDMVA